MRIGRGWLVCFGHYGKPLHDGACRTRDWKQFEDVTAKLSFPPGRRRGAVVRITRAAAERLRALR